MFKIRVKNNLLSSAALIIFSIIFISSACASVIIPNTRVIYHGDAREESIQLKNEDESPNVMEVWVDSGNIHSTPNTADGPFLVTPPVFRIAPGGGQTVRLVFTGKNLPLDRESVFYLNTLQIPSINTSYTDQNQMLVIVKNRMKLFYRPVAIEGRAQDAPEKIEFHTIRQGGILRVAANNTSNYYVSFIDGRIICGSHTANFAPGMVAPHSEEQWDVKGNCPASELPVQVKVRYLDDFGAARDAKYVAIEQTAQ